MGREGEGEASTIMHARTQQVMLRLTHLEVSIASKLSIVAVQSAATVRGSQWWSVNRVGAPARTDALLQGQPFEAGVVRLGGGLEDRLQDWSEGQRRRAVWPRPRE